MSSDPVPQGVRVELKRLAERWSQLPFDRALRRVDAVHAYTLELAEADARGSGLPADPAALAAQVLGEPRPEQVIDQLTAVLYDRFAHGASTGAPEPGDVATRLVDLRRGL